MSLHCVRNFYYHGLHPIGEIFFEADAIAARAFIVSGDCQPAAVPPVIKPWIVAIPFGPIPLSGP